MASSKQGIKIRGYQDQEHSSAHLFSSLICASSSGVKSLVMPKVCLISSGVLPLMRVATLAQHNSIRDRTSRQLAARRSSSSYSWFFMSMNFSSQGSTSSLRLGLDRGFSISGGSELRQWSQYWMIFCRGTDFTLGRQISYSMPVSSIMFLSIWDFLATASSTSNLPWSDVSSVTLLIRTTQLKNNYKWPQFDFNFICRGIAFCYIMLGSLNEFISLQAPKKYSAPSFFEPAEDKNPFDQKPKSHSCLVYRTQDKKVLLQSIVHKEKVKNNKNSNLIKKAFEERSKSYEAQNQHWIESRSIGKNNLSRQHQLLRAIVKQKQSEGVDIGKSSFEKSFGRIVQAYSRIKTQPIDTLLPPKFVDIEYNCDPPPARPPKTKSCNAKPTKIVELEKSIQWAKRHKKNFNSFYASLGKSVELIEKQRPGRNNYELQLQQKKHEDESSRRGMRRKFLKQIQRRLGRQSFDAF